MGAKKSHEIIPMCHPLLLTGIDISFEKHQKPDPETGLCSITITGTVKVTGQTGVEMEACDSGMGLPEFPPYIIVASSITMRRAIGRTALQL